MSDTTTATPPAASGGLSEAQVTKIVGESVAAALNSALKPVLDSVAALQTNQQAIAESLKKAPTAETITKAVTEQLQAQQTQASQAKARTDFIAKELANVPEAYASKLGTDPAKWGEEAKGIRDSLKADLEKLGVKPPPVGSEAPGSAGAVKPNQAIDTSKLSGRQLIALGVAQSATPIQPGANVPGGALGANAAEAAKAGATA